MLLLKVTMASSGGGGDYDKIQVIHTIQTEKEKYLVDRTILKL